MKHHFSFTMTQDLGDGDNTAVTKSVDLGLGALEDVLEAFHSFLNHCGYSYVDEVIAYSDKLSYSSDRSIGEA